MKLISLGLITIVFTSVINDINEIGVLACILFLFRAVAGWIRSNSKVLFKSWYLADSTHC